MKRRNYGKKQNGFTMVELVIVIAVLGVLGTLLVPAYGHITTKAKLTSDISTVKTLKRTADIYKAELGKWPEGNNLESLNLALTTDDYLDTPAALQTKGADIEISSADKTIKLDLTGVTDGDTKAELTSIIDKMDSDEGEKWVTGLNDTAADGE